MMNSDYRTLQQAIRETHVYGLNYTESQLYYAAERVRRRARLARRHITWGALAGLPALGLSRRPLQALSATTAGAGLLAVALWANDTMKPQTVTITLEAFRENLAKYIAQHGMPPGLLPVEAPPAWELADALREPDLADYGVDAVLICQYAEIAAMLRANDTHLLFGCPIVTAPLPDAIRRMLARAEAPHVYYLHDASLTGLQTAFDLPTQLDLPPATPFIPVGLRPIHALRLNLFCQTPVITDAHSPLWHPYYLSSAERAWLEAGYMAEVAAIPPLLLLQQIERVLTSGALALLPRESRLEKTARLLLGKVE